jgi:hypothetical protein
MVNVAFATIDRVKKTLVGNIINRDNATTSQHDLCHRATLSLSLESLKKPFGYLPGTLPFWRPSG